MPTFVEEKSPAERRRLSAEFADALLGGESLIGTNVQVTCTNVRTGASASGILLGSPSVSGTVVFQDVQAGSDGDIYEILFASGLTNISLTHEVRQHLIVSKNPTGEIILCTRDELKRTLRITDTSDDALLDDQLIAASTYIRRRTGRHFDLRTYTETIRVDENQDNIRIKLDNYPILTVDQVAFIQYDGTTDTVYTDGFDFLTEGYIWFQDGTPFYRFPHRTDITYKAGYPRIPDDVKEAVKRIATGFYRLLGREGITGERIGNYSWQRTRIRDLFPPRIRQEIDDEFIEGVVRRYARHDLDWYF